MRYKRLDPRRHACRAAVGGVENSARYLSTAALEYDRWQSLNAHPLASEIVVRLNDLNFLTVPRVSCVIGRCCVLGKGCQVLCLPELLLLAGAFCRSSL